MRPIHHLALSTVAGGATWSITGEPWALPVTVATGVLVDIDHGPDLWWTYALGHRPVATFIFHAWEWIAGLVILGIWVGFSWWLIAVLAGFGLHVITDHLTNRLGRWFYSITHRARHGFQIARLAPEWDFDEAYSGLRRDVPLAVKLIEWWKARPITRR